MTYDEAYKEILFQNLFFYTVEDILKKACKRGYVKFPGVLRLKYVEFRNGEFYIGNVNDK